MDDDSKLALQLLAEQIKKRRKALGLSQEKLAEKCGFDRTYISLLERSERNPSYLNLKKLSNGLGVSVSELLREL